MRGFVLTCFRMNLSLSSIFFLMSAVSMATVSARTWQVSYKGQVFWDNNCHFVGFVIGWRKSFANQCGGICLDNPECTHFTHALAQIPDANANGYCFLKRNTNGWREIDEPGNTCGFIRGRSSQSLRTMN